MITDLGSSAEMIRRGNIEGFSKGSNAIFENPASLYNINLVSTSVFASQIIMMKGIVECTLSRLQREVCLAYSQRNFASCLKIINMKCPIPTL